MKRKLQPKLLLGLILISLIPLWSVVSPRYWKWKVLNQTPSAEVQKLRSHLQDVDSIVVRRGGLCHRDPMFEKKLFTLRGTEAQEFIQSIHFREKIKPTPGQIIFTSTDCLCCGNPTFEFYRGKKLVLSLANKHGSSLRSTGTLWEGNKGLHNQWCVFVNVS